MARPVKNCVDYFPHDAGMRDHKKVKAIRAKFGITGYAIWSMILEYLAGSDGNVFPYNDTEFELMAGDFQVPAMAIKEVVDYCISLEMLFNKNGFINSDSLDERLAPVYAKRGKAKELSKKQLRVNGQYRSSNTEQMVIPVAEMPQSKVKESKGNESKGNEREPAAGEPATLAERATDFQNKVNEFSHQYTKEMLQDFFDYWTEKNAGGRKFRFEMQKVFDIERRLRKWKSNEDGRKFKEKQPAPKLLLTLKDLDP